LPNAIAPQDIRERIETIEAELAERDRQRSIERRSKCQRHTTFLEVRKTQLLRKSKAASEADKKLVLDGIEKIDAEIARLKVEAQPVELAAVEAEAVTLDAQAG